MELYQHWTDFSWRMTVFSFTLLITLTLLLTENRFFWNIIHMLCQVGRLCQCLISPFVFHRNKNVIYGYDEKIYRLFYTFFNVLNFNVMRLKLIDIILNVVFVYYLYSELQVLRRVLRGEAKKCYKQDVLQHGCVLYISQPLRMSSICFMIQICLPLTLKGA